MNFGLTTLLLVAVFGTTAAQAVSAEAQPVRPLQQEPGPDQLACGKKVLVENQTCPPGQILEVTGSCLNEKDVPGTLRRGRQLNCVPRK